MRIVFVGTGDFGVPALRALGAAGHAIVSCISQPDRPAGRGRQVQPTPVHAAADALRLAHLQTPSINDLAPAAAAPGAELGVVVAFGQKIGPAWLNAFPHGLINIHASLLPRHRGAAPYQWAIIRGDAETGVTVFRLNEAWDAGPILGVARTVIGDTETADELHDRLSHVGAELIAEVVRKIATGAATPLTQDATAATRAPKLSRADSRVDWSQPAKLVARRINGLWSWPGAACEVTLPGGVPMRLQICRARALATAVEPAPVSSPGTLLPDGRVRTGDGWVELLEVKPAGGKLMPFTAFANGRRLQAPVTLVDACA